MEFNWKELGSYFVGTTGMLYDKFSYTCEGLTNFFALLIVIVTFFYITIPHAKERREKKEEEEEE